jgi:hypothetical protein
LASVATGRYARSRRTGLVSSPRYKGFPSFTRRGEYFKGVTVNVKVDISTVTDELEIICNVESDLSG